MHGASEGECSITFERGPLALLATRLADPEMNTVSTCVLYLNRVHVGRDSNPVPEQFCSLPISMLYTHLIGFWLKCSTMHKIDAKNDSLTHQTDFALDNNLALGRSNHGVLCVQPLLLRTAKLFLQQGQRLLAFALAQKTKSRTYLCTNERTIE